MSPASPGIKRPGVAVERARRRGSGKGQHALTQPSGGDQSLKVPPVSLAYGYERSVSLHQDQPCDNWPKDACVSLLDQKVTGKSAH